MILKIQLLDESSLPCTCMVDVHFLLFMLQANKFLSSLIDISFVLANKLHTRSTFSLNNMVIYYLDESR